MKHILLIILISISFLGNNWAEEFTASELAKHFGVSHWESNIELPPGTFTVTVSEIRDGKLTQTGMGGMTGPADDPKGQKLVVMASSEKDGTLLSVVLGGSSMRNRDIKDKPFIMLAGSVMLPNKIREGDYVLGGVYLTRDGKTVISNKVQDVKHGLLLRVIKNSNS